MYGGRVTASCAGRICVEKGIGGSVASVGRPVVCCTGRAGSWDVAGLLDEAGRRDEVRREGRSTVDFLGRRTFRPSLITTPAIPRPAIPTTVPIQINDSHGKRVEPRSALVPGLPGFAAELP